MQLLFRVIYAAHASGTHHKLALDALGHLRIAEAEAWRRVFLKHAKTYLEGSKAPDKQFKDFKNHVLHVGDGFWGGAPEKVESWYHLLVRALAEQNWSEAAWCAGIMSHYYTDPIHPFHTAQSEAESAIHRAVEWSISKSYDTLLVEAGTLPAPEVEPRSGPGWLKDFVIAGAETSNRHYAALIAHYDFQRGVVDPPAGLDPVARQIVAGLIDYAGRGTARLLDRAITESGAKAPEVSLTVDTVLATLEIPVKWLTRKLADAADRRQVEAMYDELMATGRVDKTLPEDDRMIRDLHAKEVLSLTQAERAGQRSTRAEEPRRAQGQMFAFTPAAAAAPTAPPVKARGGRAVEVAAVSPASAIASQQGGRSAVPAVGRSGLIKAVSAARVHLRVEQDVEAAPSIGPRMAERLATVGVRTVGDLLAADPADIAARLGDTRIKAATVGDWQLQSRLVCVVPGLRGGHAQLLVGAGFTTPEAIAAAELGVLQAAVLRYATSAEGQRVLRDGQPPDTERMVDWIERAKEAQPLAA